MPFFAVYVGKFSKVPESKKTVAKLNSLGYRAYVFSLGDCYSLRVGAFASKEMANKVSEALKVQGFEAFVQ